MEQLQYKHTVAAALMEDLGFGDITTDCIFSKEEGAAEIIARESGVLAGLPLAEEVFRQIDPSLCFSAQKKDGDFISWGDILARVEGAVSSILKGERVALNFLQRLSGIATETRAAVEKVAGTGAKITDTRKTVPGLRVLEKYAVRMGGGCNHRLNLGDMVLIKDNHISGAGSITEAVARVRKCAGFTVKIEVEAATLRDVKEALACGADIIMLDNMPTGEMTAAVRLVEKRAVLEASGGIRTERLREVAAAGVDYISLGYLTHSCRALDLSLNLLPSG